ncbi:MAG TPA: hypothetical protein VGC54_11895 [Planctomycetota bacterium]
MRRVTTLLCASLAATALTAAIGGTHRQGPSTAVAIAWRPVDGRALLLDAGGKHLRAFDRMSAPAGTWETGRDDLVALTCYATQWILRDRAGDAYRFDEDLGALETWQPPAYFDPFDGIAEPLVVAGAGGRKLVARACGLLEGLAPGEHAGEIEWGPGRATLRLRTRRPYTGFVEWRVADGPVQRAALQPDRSDPTLLRAFLEPVATGALLQLRHRPLVRSHPAKEWSGWREAAAPPVDPGGPRPVSVLAGEG